MRFTKSFYLLLVLTIATTLVACGSLLADPVATRPSNSPEPGHNTPDATPTSEATPAPEPTPTSKPTPKPDISPVTGERSFARGVIKQRPYIAMIDNHPDAYPQSGLNKASIVFEALAEGGTTRFMAVYQEGVTPDVGEIGPIRSVRLYFAQWAMGFQPIFLHVGGSPDGLALVQTSDRVMNLDLDDPANSQYGWRDNRRVAPYNFYSNTERLRSFTEKHDFRKFTYNDSAIGYLFKTVAPASPPKATAITYSFQYYTARWLYDAESNGYHRTMDDQPHVDRVTGEQLWTRNLVIMEVQEVSRPSDEKMRIDLRVTGSGRANIFLAGRRIEATWRKETAESQLRFYDSSGKEIVFNAGPIWIAAVTALDGVSVQ